MKDNHLFSKKVTSYKKQIVLFLHSGCRWGVSSSGSYRLNIFTNITPRILETRVSFCLSKIINRYFEKYIIYMLRVDLKAVNIRLKKSHTKMFKTWLDSVLLRISNMFNNCNEQYKFKFSFWFYTINWLFCFLPDVSDILVT